MCRSISHEKEKGEKIMKATAMAVPILPDKVEAWKEWSWEFSEGPRKEEFVALMKQYGLTHNRCWLQQSPTGALAIVLFEGETPDAFRQQIASSQEPFAVWFRENVKEHQGMDLSKSMEGLPPELITDILLD